MSIKSTTDISSCTQDLKNDKWFNTSLARTIKDIINSNEVGTYTCKGIIVDFHPTESWYYEACGNERCYKGISKGSKVGDHCKKCNKPISKIIIRYCMRVLVEDSGEQTYFTLFEDCAFHLLKKTATQLLDEMESETGDRNGTPDILATLLEREFLFVVDVSMRFGARVCTIKQITEDIQTIAQFSAISRVHDDVEIIE
ncbi:replication factor A protein 1-like [Salvia miltiorrhiza]|uniref:replication factor A protein 1-like n=1 Tax=Salvia miltiorrhiza TaxID=226208 RepID=UPI0025AD1F24|nr:replication factor A protein 1-like [Salvia miltiorrhiza]